MLRDLTNPKKVDKQAVLTAIAALRAKAWDINPYTLADEMKTSRTNIYRNSEIMELVNEARQQAGLPMIHTDDTSSEPQHEPTESTHSKKELEDHIRYLENENNELHELQKNNWQRGYKAGWDEASIYLANAAPFPTEPIVDSLPESNYEQNPESSDYSSEPVAEQSYTSESYTDYNNAPTSEVDSNAYPETVAPDYSYIDNQGIGLDNQYSPEVSWPEAQAEESEETISPEDLQNLLKQHREKSEVDATPVKAKGLAASKFARTPNEPPQRGFILRTVPPDIRKSCLVLGIRPEDLGRQAIIDAWKREIARPGTHPDQGGDSEIAVYLNTAKDVLLRWWETQEPKLGKQFGNQAKQSQASAEEPDETEPSM